MRSDSAAYQADIINYCESEGIDFAIGADLDEAVPEAIGAIPDKNISWGHGFLKVRRGLCQLFADICLRIREVTTT